VVSGELRVSLEGGSGSRPAFGQKLQRGENVVLPFSGAFTFSAEATTILLLTENFV
jgi:mannose-6-phosphate isomerase